MWQRKSDILTGFHCKYLSELEKYICLADVEVNVKIQASYLPPPWGLFYIVLYCILMY